MKKFPAISAGPGIDRKTFVRLARTYRRDWGIFIYAVRADGTIAFGRPPCPRGNGAACREARAFALRESFRWGEPTVASCPRKRLLWAAPIMQNEILLGGLVASATEQKVFSTARPLDIRRAGEALRLLLERENLTNASALELRRRQYRAEQERAHAIHAYKTFGHDDIRELYLREEPALFAAIRSGDRGQAREILNRILVVIHHHAGNRMDLVKSLFLELVVAMSRTAVEAGGRPEELLGANFATMSDLARMDVLEDLAAWLSRTLEHLMNSIERRRAGSPSALFDAIAFLEKHGLERVSRRDAARAAHLSPSRFSHRIRAEAGTTFTNVRNRIRMDRAADLLAHTQKTLGVIAIETGFPDQSYFTKVFKRYYAVTPRRYRLDAVRVKP